MAPVVLIYSSYKPGDNMSAPFGVITKCDTQIFMSGIRMWVCLYISGSLNKFFVYNNLDIFIIEFTVSKWCNYYQN